MRRVDDRRSEKRGSPYEVCVVGNIVDPVIKSVDVRELEGAYE